MVTGFQDSMKLAGIQERHGDSASKEEKIDYILDNLGDRLDLNGEKIRQAKQICEQDIDFTALKKGSNGELDLVAFCGALLHVVSRQHPVTPRWIKLVASECQEFAINEGRVKDSVGNRSVNDRWSEKNRGIKNPWKDKVRNFKRKITNQGIGLENVSGVHYAHYIAGAHDLPENLKGMAATRMALLEQSPEFQGKDRVALAAAIVHRIAREFGEEGVSFEDLARSVCVKDKTLKEYSEDLEGRVI